MQTSVQHLAAFGMRPLRVVFILVVQCYVLALRLVPTPSTHGRYNEGMFVKYVLDTSITHSPNLRQAVRAFARLI